MDKINKISPGQNDEGGLLAALTGRNTDFGDGENEVPAETVRQNKDGK
jgi:hypothetical protein